MQVSSVDDDFADGVLLLNLLEVCFQHRFDAYNRAPKLPFHKLENVTLALEFMEKELGCQLIGIDSLDITKKKEKQTTNVLWSALRASTLRNLAEMGLAGT
jgi:filamin